MPRPAKYHNPRERILDAAHALVVARGFDAVSLRGVAREAGFSPAALYGYFEDKRALLGALAGQANAMLREALRSVAAPTPDGLVALGRAYVDFARAHPERFQLLFSRSVSARRSLAEPPPADSAYGVVRDAVAAGVGAGALRLPADLDVEGASYALWALAHGQAMLQLTTLAGFGADFPAADAAALSALVHRLRP